MPASTAPWAAAGLRPAPGPARAWLERELSRPEYHQSLLERVQHWLDEVWQRLTQGALDADPLSAGAAIVLAVVLLGLLVALVSRARRNPVVAAGPADAVVVPDVSADEHRARAAAALEEGDPATAMVEGFRALAARSVGRGLVQPRPGLTAHELAADLAPRFPEHREALLGAAAHFDQVFYGDQPVDADAARAVLDLDDTLRRARPNAPATHHDVDAVPR